MGPRIWGEQWTGRELWARPLRPPEEETKDIEAMRAELEKLERELRSAAEVFDKAGIAYEKVSLDPSNEPSRLSDLRSELASRAPVDQKYRAEYAAYQRFLEVEDQLLGGLAQGETVSEIQGYEGVIELRASDWKRRKHEKRRYSLELSLIEPLDGDIFDQPRKVRVRRDEKFEAWFRKVRSKGAPLTTTEDAEEECRRWLESEVAKGKNHTKPWYRKEAKRRFGVSDRQFSRIWDDVVPAHWKSPGPVKGLKRKVLKDRRTP
jgi:hypothetical protein